MLHRDDSDKPEKASKTEKVEIEKQLDDIIFASGLNIYERGVRAIELIHRYGRTTVDKFVRAHNCGHTLETLLNAVENLDFLFKKPYFEQLPKDSNGKIHKTFIDYVGALLEKSHDRNELAKKLKKLFDDGTIRSTTKTEDAKKFVRKAKEGSDRYKVTSYRLHLSSMKKSINTLTGQLKLYEELKADNDMKDVRDYKTENILDAMLAALKDQI